MMRVLLAASLALAFAASASAAQFYKWKDANGVWQYTTTPPPAGADSKRVSVQNSDGSADVASIDPGQTDTTAAPEGDFTGGDPGATAEIRAKRQKACTDARARESDLMNSAAVAMDKDGDGKAETLSVDEQSAELSRAKQAVRIYCNG